MLLLFFVTALALQPGNSLVYDALFDVFNALYFSSGLQFQTGIPTLPIGWIEGDLQLASNISCNMSMDGLKKDCHVFFKTGTVIFLSANGNGTNFKINGISVAATISELNEKNKFILSVSSAEAISYDYAARLVNGKEEPIQVDVHWISDQLKLCLDVLSFQYDKYIDSYPVQPQRDEAMRQIIGYVMHSKGNLRQ